jgi:hypothetical protein
MDFIGPIYPPLEKNKHILVCTKYLTKWVEVRAINDATKSNVYEFIQEGIFSRFGYSHIKTFNLHKISLNKL